mgnify:CR=1 FL=1
MFGNVLFFGRKNCAHTLLIKKFLKKNSKNFYYFESSKVNEKIDIGKIKKKTFEYIISFRSFFILKKELLEKCNVAAINFHPGSPEFRGLGSVNYAIYNGSKFYGSTAHILNEKIDSGTIIDVEKFKLKKKDDVEKVLSKTHSIMCKQAFYVINLLLKDKKNLEKLVKKSKNYKWSNKILNMKKLNKFYEIKKNISKKELIKKIRSTNTKKYKPYIAIKDKKFYLDINNKDLNFLLNININENQNMILKKIDLINNIKFQPFINLYNNKFVLFNNEDKIKVLIIGSGNHSRMILSEILNSDRYECIGFIDEIKKKGTIIMTSGKTKYKVLGKIDDIKTFNYKDVFGIIGIGLNYKRKKVAEKIETKFKNFKWVTIISKNCLINKGVKIGDGSFIVTGSTINNGTIIGNHCLINTSSSIDHDNLFEDYSSTGPGVITGGQVKVGNSAHIGIGSVVKQKISIGKNALIGAKSLVIKNCLIDTVYYGSPVKKIRTRNYNEKYL